MAAAGVVALAATTAGLQARREDPPETPPVTLGAAQDVPPFSDSHCDHWWPEPGGQSYGWSYRACLVPDPSSPTRWVPGAEVRNLGTQPAAVEVYVSWVRVPVGGGANAVDGHQSVPSGPVAPGGTGRVAVAPVAHPGAASCLWTEIAPLITPQQRWSDSPLRTADGDLCVVG